MTYSEGMVILCYCLMSMLGQDTKPLSPSLPPSTSFPPLPRPRSPFQFPFPPIFPSSSSSLFPSQSAAFCPSPPFSSAATPHEDWMMWLWDAGVELFVVCPDLLVWEVVACLGLFVYRWLGCVLSLTSLCGCLWLVWGYIQVACLCSVPGLFLRVFMA